VTVKNMGNVVGSAGPQLYLAYPDEAAAPEKKPERV
jgi:hypothetical protein